MTSRTSSTGRDSLRNFDMLTAEEIIQCFAWTCGRHHKPSGPGQAVMECDEETREKFRNLKSDDLSKVRADIARNYACFWNYKEPWEVNLGKAPPTRMSDEKRSAMLIKFDKEMLGN
jgi:hypothetical protein